LVESYMNIIRDCLDKQLVDRRGNPIGRVDGIVMNWRQGQRPKLAFVELGAVTRAYRLHSAWGRFVERWIKRLSPTATCRCPVPWSKVVPTGTSVTAAVDADDMRSLAWEKWLRKHIVERIPGA
jgi:hypothetical protein